MDARYVPGQNLTFLQSYDLMIDMASIDEFFIFVYVGKGIKQVLIFTQIFTDSVNIRIEFFCMFHSVFSNFSYERVFHDNSPSNSSGEVKIGQIYPAPSIISLTLFLVNGLFICLKFQVTIKSTFATAASAI